MLKTFKIEIKPTNEQKIKIEKTIGVCRFIYNKYISYNKENYEKGKKFISGFDFSKYINNDFIPNNPEYIWIKEVSSKAVKKSIMNGETAFKKFFNKKANFPKFKKKNKDNIGIYLPKNGKKEFEFYRHKIKIPTLKFVRVKEYGYIPKNAKIKSCVIKKECNKYFCSILCEIEENKINFQLTDKNIGIDLGIKNFAILSNDKIFKNINKSQRIKKLKKKLKREQRKLSKKYKTKVGEKTANINKQILKIQKIHFRLKNIRNDYINKMVSELVKTKPNSITIEDLKISNMLKNKHLSKFIIEQKFYYFKERLINKCKYYGISLKLANKFYPSSKKCSCCGYIKNDLKLSDRTYKCPNCGFELDRDLNAAINLEKCETYKLIS